MITKQDIRELHKHQGYPCVSLFIQTHKTMPDRLQDHIRIKDMVKEAADKLYAESKKEDVSKLVKALENLAEKIDYTKLLKGIGLFASQNFAKAYILPFNVSPKIVIDKIFATKELIKGMSVSNPFWVLSISHKPARLFKAQGEGLIEIIDDSELQQNMQGFPFKLNYDVTNDSKQQAYSVGDISASYVSRQLDYFMHQLDNLLFKTLAQEHLPIVIVGTQKNRSDFEKVTRFKKDIIVQIEGDCTHLAIEEIEKIINKQMVEFFKKENAQIIAYLNEAVGKNHCVFGIKDVWRQARIGMIRTLIIEDNYQVPAYIDDKNPDEVIIYDKFNTPGGYKDITDDITSKVFNSKGKVLFVNEGSLSKFEKIAAILWY